MKHKQLSKREELLFELQGWIILSGDEMHPNFKDNATIPEIALAIYTMTMSYRAKMISKGIESPEDPRNQFSLN